MHSENPLGMRVRGKAALEPAQIMLEVVSSKGGRFTQPKKTCVLVEAWDVAKHDKLDTDKFVTENHS